MYDITVSSPDDQIEELKDKSSRLSPSLLELVLLSIQDILPRPVTNSVRCRRLQPAAWLGS